jgi:sulfur carrier protein ThiS
MMNEPTKKITVPEGSSLAKLLTDLGSRPILLEKNGELYRLERMENKDNTASPEEVARSKDGILKAAGSWKDIDTEAFKAYIAERRHTANRPSVKL